MGIKAIFYDEYGKKVGESIEAFEEERRPKRQPSSVPQETDCWKGTQRRPARRHPRFQ
jgi:hypothetical protein